MCIILKVTPRTVNVLSFFAIGRLFSILTIVASSTSCFGVGLGLGVASVFIDAINSDTFCGRFFFIGCMANSMASHT
ncbi:MAG: hypothetical protein PUD26_03645, partial [bacterium]|nr:hypothetical protein [bacterium]